MMPRVEADYDSKVKPFIPPNSSEARGPVEYGAAGANLGLARDATQEGNEAVQGLNAAGEREANDLRQIGGGIENAFTGAAGIAHAVEQHKQLVDHQAKIEQDLRDKTAVNNATANWKTYANKTQNQIESDKSTANTWDTLLQNKLKDAAPSFIDSQNFTPHQKELFSSTLAETNTPFIMQIQDHSAAADIAYKTSSTTGTLNALSETGGQLGADVGALQRQVEIMEDPAFRGTVYLNIPTRIDADKLIQVGIQKTLTNFMDVNYQDPGTVRSVVNNPAFSKFIDGATFKHYNEEADQQEQKNIEYADKIHTAVQWDRHKQAADIIDHMKSNIENSQVVAADRQKLQKLLQDPTVQKTLALRDQIAEGINASDKDKIGIQERARADARFSMAMEGQARALTTFGFALERHDVWEDGQRQLAKLSSPEGIAATKRWGTAMNDLESSVQGKNINLGFAQATEARHALDAAKDKGLISAKLYTAATNKVNSNGQKLSELLSKKEPRQAVGIGAFTLPMSGADRMINARLTLPEENFYKSLGYKPGDLAQREKAKNVWQEKYINKINEFQPYTDKSGLHHDSLSDTQIHQAQQWAADAVKLNISYYGL